MPGNSIGQIFRVTTFGESHGECMGVVVDGCPANMNIDLSKIQAEVDRRKTAQTIFATQRSEEDSVQFVSGIYEGKTTGAPITALILNRDIRSQDYDHLKHAYRPSHADYTYHKKYGIRDYKGGGRASARETVARVVAGAIAKQLLEHWRIQVRAYVSEIGLVKVNEPYTKLDLAQSETSEVRCPDPKVSKRMLEAIEAARLEGDTLGGVVTGIVCGAPEGLGEPVFDKLHADIGKAMLSINAVKGFDYGAGFRSTEMHGSQMNDPFIKEGNRIVTQKNDSGGIQGGISNGMDIVFRVAFKPVSTLMRSQSSVTVEGESIELKGRGRHDACVVPRAVPIVEAMAAIVLADHLLRNRLAHIGNL